MNRSYTSDHATQLMLSRATGRVDRDGRKLKLWFAEPPRDAVAVPRSSHPSTVSSWLVQSGYGAAQVATKMSAQTEDCATQPYNLPATLEVPARTVMMGTSVEGKRGNATLEVSFPTPDEAKAARRAFVSEIADFQTGIPPRQAFKPLARGVVAANEHQAQMAASGTNTLQSSGPANTPHQS